MRLRRRKLLGLVGGMVATLGLAQGCGQRPLLSALSVSPLGPNGTARITPDGGELNDQLKVGFTLGRRATIRVTLNAANGTAYTLRGESTRAPDDYEISFKGVVAVPDSPNRRVLPDGNYRLLVWAQAEDGQVAQQELALAIANADTTPPEITRLTTSLTEISPNGDGEDDEVTVSYGLTKACTTTIYVLDQDGNRYLIEAPKKKNATLQSHLWDGTSGGKVLRDGKYTFHVEAEDAAGNFTDASVPIAIANGGTPRLEIVDAKFTPIALSKGGVLNVRIKVKNTGDTQIKTLGPPPGTRYTTQMNFASFRDPNDPNIALYYERAGVWRVGVQWTNAPQLYPVRWGLFTDLNRTLGPGEEATVDGEIQILEGSTHELTFWASVVQEGVGYPGGQVGHQQVKVSF